MTKQDSSLQGLSDATEAELESLFAELALAKDWLTPEEAAAWADL